jgi:hypothetical protein
MAKDSTRGTKGMMGGHRDLARKVPIGRARKGGTGIERINGTKIKRHIKYLII